MVVGEEASSDWAFGTLPHTSWTQSVALVPSLWHLVASSHLVHLGLRNPENVSPVICSQSCLSVTLATSIAAACLQNDGSHSSSNSKRGNGAQHAYPVSDTNHLHVLVSPHLIPTTAG